MIDREEVRRAVAELGERPERIDRIYVWSPCDVCDPRVVVTMHGAPDLEGWVVDDHLVGLGAAA